MQLGNTKSQLHGISIGIPQGSVMGPLLFNIVINDLNAATHKFNLIMYADDTTLISTPETFGNTNRYTEIENNISNEISKITTWLQLYIAQCLQIKVHDIFKTSQDYP